MHKLPSTYTNIVIESVATAHPTQKIDNQFFIEHFKNMGLECEGLLNHLGRKERYIDINGEYTIVTLIYEACLKALERANIKPEEIDMIMLSTDTPDTTSPSNASILSNMLGTVNAYHVYDMNTNCTGMLNALDLASVYAKSKNNIKNILVVGGSLMSPCCRPDCTVTYPTLGDGAAAVVMRKVEEEFERGFIDSFMYTNPIQIDYATLPACGLTDMYRGKSSMDKFRFQWIPFDNSYLAPEWTMCCKNVIESNGLTPSDIKHFAFSQFSRPDAIKAIEGLGIAVNEDNFTFVAEEFGYTGASSPFFALERAIETGKISKGDYIVFCSVATGYSMTSLLVKL